MDQVITYNSDIVFPEVLEDDLLFYMSLKDEEDYLDISRESFGEFYNRYYIIVFNRIFARYNNFLSKEEAQDLTSKTFIKVFEKSGTFSFKGIREPELIKNTVLSWVFQIAKNICLDEYDLFLIEKKYLEMLKQRKTQILPIGDVDEKRDDTIDISKIINELLNPKEQEVVLTTLEHFQIDKENQRLSNEESKKLAEKLGTTPENIRQIRSRAYRKIKEYLQNQ